MVLSNTEQEMLQSKDICASFDFSKTEQLAKKIGERRVIFSGMGSSLIFPGKQAKHRSLLYNLENLVEVSFASDLLQYTNFKDTFLFLCSNSGQTKEVILLLEHARKHGAFCVGITAVEDSPLAKQSDEVFILTGGLEKGVAATKSVVEQALLCDSLIFHLARKQGHTIDYSDLQENLQEASDTMISNINLTIEKKLIQSLTQTPQYFFVGLDNGAAEEIALKAQELIHKPSFFYPDTQILHGPAETIQTSAIILFGSAQFAPYLDNLYELEEKTSSTLVKVDRDPASADIPIKINQIFQNYCFLSAGWGILRRIGENLAVDFDHPEKIAKVSTSISAKDEIHR